MSLRALDVLFVEDSESDAKLVARALERSGYDLTWERVETTSALLEAFERRRWNLVISDSNVPGLGVLEALAQVQQFAAGVPFVIVSGAIREDLAAEALQRGAASCVGKDDLARLGSVLDRVLVEREEGIDDPLVLALGDARRLVELARVERGPARAKAFERALAALDEAIRQARELSETTVTPAALRGSPDLTPRQREVLQLIADGHPTSDIARRLRISVKTVESHRAQIMERLNIRHVPGLVRYAIRFGIVVDA